MDKPFLFKKGNNNNFNRIIVSFGGQGLRLGLIPPFEFMNFLSSTFKGCDKLFFIDKHQCWYQKGLKDLTSDIKTSVEFIKNKIKKYKEVIFIGASSGGYASILFGSLLNIQKVIVFFPQTYIDLKKIDNKEYFNLKKFINNTTQYYVFCDLSKDGVHHPNQCYNIKEFKNVTIFKHQKINLKIWRANGKLKKNMIFLIKRKKIKL